MWIVLAFFILTSWVLLDCVRYMVPTPTSARVQQKLFSMLPELASGTIVELGSGFGFLSLALARRYKGCHVIGVEISRPVFAISVVLAKCFGLKNLKLVCADMRKYNLSHADLVVCYLYRKGMQELEPKFHRELKPGALVASHTFALPITTEPTLTTRANDIYRTPLYLYRY